jgi:uncharacterized damage-inducible protein DinB
MITTTGAVGAVDVEFIAVARLFLKEDFLPRLLSCLEQMPEEDVWWRPNEASNSAGNLVLHLSGNMRQWIVASIAGEKFERNRDGEFAARGPIAKAELIQTIQATIADVDEVLAGLPADRLTQRHRIQMYDVSGLQAVFHVVEHFSYHLGQILYIYKLRTGVDPGFYRDLSNR